MKRALLDLQGESPYRVTIDIKSLSIRNQSSVLFLFFHCTEMDLSDQKCLLVVVTVPFCQTFCQNTSVKKPALSLLCCRVVVSGREYQIPAKGLHSE